MKKLILTWLFLIVITGLHAQRFEAPEGERIIKKDILSHGKGESGRVTRFVATNKNLYVTYYSEFLRIWIDTKIPFTAPDGNDIVSFERKKGYKDRFLILLYDGSVYEYWFNGSELIKKLGKVSEDEFGFERFIGDDLYVLNTQAVYVSRDSGSTWQIDTAGLGEDFIQLQDISIDSNQNVYLITFRGDLFKQALTSNTWTKLYSDLFSLQTIFVDRKERIWLGTNEGPYVSTDGGATFQLDTAGIGSPRMGSFGDDAFVNVYAITQDFSEGSMMFCRKETTGKWQRIDKPISDLNLDKDNTFIFNDIGGDTIILAATNFGVFFSLDQGNTWKLSNEGIESEQNNALLRAADNSFLVATNLGVFRRKAGDTVWEKTYPLNGFLSIPVLYTDKNQIIYLQGEAIDERPSFNYGRPGKIFKSSDNGATWVQDDSTGLAAIESPETFFVDENGTQYYADYNRTGNPIFIYSRKPGEKWKIDTAGFSAKTFFDPFVFGSNGMGTIYAGVIDVDGKKMWRRNSPDGPWALDTAGRGFGVAAYAYDLDADKDGNMISGGDQFSVYKRSPGAASAWKLLPRPSGLNGTSLPYVTSTDGNGTIYAAFSYYNDQYSLIGDGIHYTDNDGATWKTVEGNTDTIAFRQLVTYGDTTYGISFVNGIYIFTKEKPSSVNALESRMISGVYPNPASNKLLIKFQLVHSEKVSLTIHDLTGREVKQALNQDLSGGIHQVEVNISNLQQGIYCCRLQTGNMQETEKVIIVR